MRPMKASELVKMLQNHITRKGDDVVFLYDDYCGSYKTFNALDTSHINNNFVITCVNEEE